MKSEWFQGLDEGTKAGRVEQVMSARPTLKLLKNILEAKLEARVKDGLSKKNYEYASWPYAQADSIAEQRILREVIELITLTKEDTNE